MAQFEFVRQVSTTPPMTPPPLTTSPRANPLWWRPSTPPLIDGLTGLMLSDSCERGFFCQSEAGNVASAPERPGTPFHLNFSDGACQGVGRWNLSVGPIAGDEASSRQPVDVGSVSALSGALFGACASNDLEAVKTLIDCETSLVNTMNSNGKSPLRVAVENESMEVLDYLLHFPVDPAALDEDTMSPLEFARKNGFSDVVVLLQDKIIYNLKINFFNQANTIREHENWKMCMQKRYEEMMVTWRKHHKRMKRKLAAYRQQLEREGEERHIANKKSICQEMSWDYQMKQKENRHSAQIMFLKATLLEKEDEINQWQRMTELYRCTNCQLELHDALEQHSAFTTDLDRIGLEKMSNRIQQDALCNFELSKQIFDSLKCWCQELQLVADECVVNVNKKYLGEMCAQ